MGGVKKQYSYPSQRMNFSINRDLYESFKIMCKAQNVAINTILETFMRQYVDGEFKLDYGRNTGIMSVKAEESVNEVTNIQIMPDGFVIDFDADDIKAYPQVSTTISQSVFAAFKRKAEMDGCTIKMVIENFMRLYVDGGFYLRLKRDVDNDKRSEPVEPVVKNVRVKLDEGKTEFGEFVEELHD